GFSAQNCKPGTEQCDAGGGSICVLGAPQAAGKRCLENPLQTCTSDSAGCTCGNSNTADHCRSTTSGDATQCNNPKCGDGITDSGEGCDTGASNSDTTPGACRTNCAGPTCGDGVIDPPFETCDEGANNGAGSNCTDTCKCSDCGDAKVDSDTSTLPASCSANHPNQTPANSNPATEKCDDGNAVNTDTCLNNCNLNQCGDGVVNTINCVPHVACPGN